MEFKNGDNVRVDKLKSSPEMIISYVDYNKEGAPKFANCYWFNSRFELQEEDINIDHLIVLSD